MTKPKLRLIYMLMIFLQSVMLGYAYLYLNLSIPNCFIATIIIGTLTGITIRKLERRHPE